MASYLLMDKSNTWVCEEVCVSTIKEMVSLSPLSQPEELPLDFLELEAVGEAICISVCFSYG